MLGKKAGGIPKEAALIPQPPLIKNFDWIVLTNSYTQDLEQVARRDRGNGHIVSAKPLDASSIIRSNHCANLLSLWATNYTIGCIVMLQVLTTAQSLQVLRDVRKSCGRTGHRPWRVRLDAKYDHTGAVQLYASWYVQRAKMTAYLLTCSELSIAPYLS